jgi:hypothetical protein
MKNFRGFEVDPGKETHRRMLGLSLLVSVRSPAGKRKVHLNGMSLTKDYLKEPNSSNLLP